MSETEANSSLKRVAHNLFKKYDDRLPIIINRDPNAPASVPTLEKKKYLVPHGLTVGSLMVTIRSKTALPEHKTIQLITKDENYQPSAPETMSDLHEKYKSADGFLYFIYKVEDGYG